MFKLHNNVKKFFLTDLEIVTPDSTKSLKWDKIVNILLLEQKSKMHWNGIQKTYLLSYCTSKSEQAENSLVLPRLSRSG